MAFPSPEDDHRERSQEPMYWLNKASDLHASAGALWYCMEHQRPQDVAKFLGLDNGLDMTVATWQVYRMLCGMALELAYKAIAVSKGKKVITTHNLVELAEEANVPLYDPKSRDVLELLTGCIVWDGKYPVPKKHETMEEFAYLSYDTLYRKERTGNLTVLKPLEPDPLDWQEFQKFWKQAIAVFEWESGREIS